MFETVLSLLIALIIALAVVGVVYWCIMKLISASGVALPPVVPVVIQIAFVLVAVFILVKYVPPLLEALV